MDIKRLVNALLRKAWILIFLAVLGGGGAWYINKQVVPVYRADCTLYVFNIEKALQKGQTLNQSDLNYSLSLVQNFSELIKSRRVTAAAADTLSAKGMTGINEELLNGMVTLGTQKQSNIIVVSAVSTDPQAAAMVSNAMSQAFVDTLNLLTNSKTVDILDAATMPEYPVPNNSRNKMLFGILGGFILGFGIIYLQELLDNTVRSVEDIEQELGMQVIGLIPEHKIR